MGRVRLEYLITCSCGGARQYAENRYRKIFKKTPPQWLRWAEIKRKPEHKELYEKLSSHPVSSKFNGGFKYLVIIDNDNIKGIDLKGDDGEILSRVEQ